jgi:hypothetical protein
MKGLIGVDTSLNDLQNNPVPPTALLLSSGLLGLVLLPQRKKNKV